MGWSQRRSQKVRSYILLLFATAFGTAVNAQVRPARSTAAPHLPVLRPTVVELAQFRDSGGPLPYEVALSPNGRLMVYFGCTSWTVDICMMVWNTATHERHELVTGPVHTFAWGQKGDQIVFQTHQGPLRYRGSELSRSPAIWTMRLDSLSGEPTEAPHHVANVAVNHGVFFSPDEQTIAFAQWHGWYVSSVSLVPAAGGTPRVLASGVEVHSLRWSADGSALFYRAHESSTSPTATRYRISLTGGTPLSIEPERLAPLDVGDSLWLVREPAAMRPVAYMVMPAGVETAEWAGLDAWPGRDEMGGVRYVRPRGLRVVSLANRSVRDLVDTTAEVVGAAAWSAGDRVAVVVRRNGRTLLLTERADGTDARTFPLVHTRSVEQLQISPDGRYAAFIGASGGYGTIELVELASGRQRTLVTSADDFGSGNSPEGRGLGGLAWSQDSKKVLYIADVWTAAPAVHEVTLTGSETILRPLPRFIYGPAPLWFPSPSNPRFVEFAGARNLQGGGAVTLVPIEDALPRVLLTQPALGGPMSPDGRTLAVQIPPSNGQGGIQLKLISIDGSNARDLPLPFIALPGVTWHPDGQHLIVIGRASAGAPASVYSVPINGSSPSSVASLGSTREESLSVSADGRFVAVTVSGTPVATFLKLKYDRARRIPSAANQPGAAVGFRPRQLP
jgi:Tol biopolymer transport system component